MIDFELFLNECNNLASYDMLSAKLLCRRAGEIFAYNDDYSLPDNIYKLFYSSDKSGLSKSQFYKLKKIVTLFYQWLNKKRVVSRAVVNFVDNIKLEDVISVNEISICYYRNLDEVINFISMVGRKKGLSGDDDLLNIKCVSVLAWHGIRIQQMPDLLLSDMRDDSFSIEVSNQNGKHSSVYLDKYYGHIKRLSLITEYRGFPSGKLERLPSSEFLFKSPRNDFLSANGISHLIERFNQEAYVLFNKKISLSALYRNGVLFKMYELEKERGLDISKGSLVKELIDCDRPFAFGYAKLFGKWKEILQIK